LIFIITQYEMIFIFFSGLEFIFTSKEDPLPREWMNCEKT